MAVKGNKAFLRSYSTQDAYLQRPQPKIGKPGLVEGTGPDGKPVLIREWRKGSGEDDRAINELWRSELRLLYRLAGSPGAADNIARLIDAGSDNSAYYIVISTGQRRPLALYLPERNGAPAWQRQTASAANRRKLWANLRRIATGLDLLHLQGLIHCNLDAWAVLTSGGGEPDFQLTGFEWSMRLAGGSKHLSARRGEDARAYSFMDDWASFGRLAATLLNLKQERLTNSKLASFEVSESTSAEEISLLRDLIDPPHLLQLDGQYVKDKIDAILSSLQDAAASDEAQYYLIVNTGGDLSQSVRVASDLSIEVDDVEGQIAFITSDLSQEPRILTVEGRSGTYHALRGVQLVYFLDQYVVRNATPSWEFAKLERADLADDWKGRVVHSAPLPPTISILTMAEASKRAPRARGRTLTWDRLFDDVQETTGPARRQQRFLAAITTLYALELVMASADFFPVEANATKEDLEGDEGYRIVLTVRTDPVREQLWHDLGLRSSRERLRAILEADIVPEDEGWLLADRRKMSRRTSGDDELEFDSADFSAEPPRYVFRTKTPPTPGVREAVLIPGSLRGTLEQFLRRNKAIDGLRRHAELLATLADPRSTARTSIENVKKDPAFVSLDPAKQNALEELYAVLPVYGVQGPPGVGKTYLVREAVRRTFADEPASRLLLTAQSHFAVDHLMHELQKDWKEPPGTDLLAVRSRSREAKAPPSPLDVSVQRHALIDAALKGKLFGEASVGLRERLESLKGQPKAEDKSRATVDRRTLDGLVLRAANVLFATSNSRDLERLHSEHGQFDWTIIEEAGKATGVELLMPLLLSHRRLMIGDHKQLPPFGSEQIDELLDNPQLLKTSLLEGLQFVERELKGSIDEELMEVLESESEADMARLCADAKRALFYFETLVVDELARQRKTGARLPNQASVLTVQHRMHPTIADLVSECFYGGKLTTWSKAEERFATEPCPVGLTGAGPLQPKPVTILDMDYQQSNKGARELERLPRYSNTKEVQAVLGILGRIEPVPGKKPTLAILSPYRQQLNLLKNTVMEHDETLVRRFAPSIRSTDWFGTVDSFQGNEADVVILSLVRNNHHSSVRSALGFLSNEQRMNVALSRAKWRLFVVTSLEFLQTVISPAGGSAPPEVEFLMRFLRWVDHNRQADKISVVPQSKLGI